MAKRATERLIADRYNLQRILGRGGMGVVWRARDTLLGRDVAVKEVQLPPSLNAEEQQAMRARVMREARAAARLNHPNVVTLYDVVREEGRTFIVMELVEAPTLDGVVRERGPLPPDEVAAIGLQVLDALRAAHQVGIVHRDVKPGNVMVPPGEGRAKLADFGIASLAGDPQLTSTGLVLGSPAYMAPEQANGSLVGPPVDLWALGATMYLAVEGEPPFERGAAVATLTAVVNEPPRPLRRAGPLEPVVLALLAKEPSERPTAGQLHPQLERIAGRGARRATPTVVLPPPPAEDRQPTTPLPAVPPATPHEAPTVRQPAEPDQAPAGPDGDQAAAPAEAEAAARTEATEAGAARAERAPAGAEADRAKPDAAPPVAPRPPLPTPAPVARRRSRAPLLLSLLALALVGVALVGVLAATMLNGNDRGRTPPRATSAPSGTTAPKPTGTTAGGGAQPSGGGAAPAGFQQYSNPERGYAVAYPAGWKVDEKRSKFNTTVFSDPKSARTFAIYSSKPPNHDLVGASDRWERTVSKQRKGFQLIRQEQATYQGKRAVITEYTYEDKGERVHERHVNVDFGTRGYAVVASTTDGDWAAADRDVFRVVEQSLRVP